jgi:phage tail protein X
MRTVIAILVLGFACGLATGQWFQDPFNYSPGTVVPGYTEQRGDWSCSGTDVRAQSTVTFQELTNDTYADTDACVEVVATYDANNPNLIYAGPILRHSGSGAAAKFFMVKVQDNSSPYLGFDSYFVYFYDGSGWKSVGIAANNVGNFTQVRVRLQVIEQTSSVLVQMYLDTDMDGMWDIVKSANTTYGTGTSGQIGINGYRSAIVDDLKFFNATLYLSGTPRIGSAVTLPGRGSPNLQYVGACSFSNPGFNLLGRTIPLGLDPLLFLSFSVPAIFTNFQGSTDANGDFAMTLHIPGSPLLVGLTIWSSAVTLDPQGRLVEVAPDTEITFTT